MDGKTLLNQWQCLHKSIGLTLKHTPYTVNCLYFISCTFSRFLKITLYLQNYFWTKIMSTLCNLYTSVIRKSVHKMTLFKYFKKAPNALPNPNGHFWHHTQSDAISPGKSKVSVLVHQDAGQNIKAIYMTQGPYAIVSLQTWKAFLPPLRLNPYCAKVIHMLDKVDKLNHVGMTAMLPRFGHTSPYSFVKLVFVKPIFSHWITKYRYIHVPHKI